MSNALAFIMFGIAGVLAIVFFALSGAFEAGGSDTGGGIFGPPQIVCDLTVTISGNFYDSGIIQDTNSEQVGNPQVTNCHEKAFGDYFTGSLFPSAGLFWKSNLEVYAKAYVEGEQFRESTHATVISDAGTIEQSFSKQVKFESLPQGETFEIRVFTSKSPDTARASETFTA